MTAEDEKTVETVSNHHEGRRGEWEKKPDPVGEVYAFSTALLSHVIRHLLSVKSGPVPAKDRKIIPPTSFYHTATPPPPDPAKAQCNSGSICRQKKK